MKKILIIKLGAKGDVIRTLSVLPALKDKYGRAEIYWVTRQNVKQLLEGNPYIKKVYTLPYETDESFDELYNFDIEPEATEIAKEIIADKKYGFYSNEDFPAAFNIGAEYYLNTLYDDEIKRENKKTYQEMIFEAAELPYNKDHCPIYLTEKDIEYANKFLINNKISEKILIGIHMGASSTWPSKTWSKSKIKEFVDKVKKKGYGIILFGGPNEIKQHSELIQELKSSNLEVYSNKLNNSDREFASLINLCKKLICSDSFALHVAIALKKPTICLFFCTSPYEIEGYGILKKVVSPMLYNFYPKKMDQYSEELVNSISVEDVLEYLD